GADAKLVMQEALGASVFVHTVLPGLAAITGEKAQAMVAATGEIVAAINGLQATLQGLTVSATVQGAAAAVRHAVSLTKADMDHLVTVTVAAGKASTDVSGAGVDLTAVIGAASVDAYDQMTAALVAHTIQVGNAAVVMTARVGAAATLAAHDLGLARIALQGAVGVADVTWATSVANAQSAYDALMGRGQVAAAERLRDPFETYKATQAQIGGDLRTKLAVNDVERKIAAEQHATSSGGFNGDWSKTFTYVIGGLQIGGAAAEMNLGATLLTTSAVMASTGVGIPAALLTGALGLFLVCHGLDHANAGFQSIVTGAPQRTLTSQALDSLTGSEFYSDIIDGALGMAAGAAGAKILRLATMTDDMGRCMNMFSRAHYGGCFTGDTLVHVTAVVDGEPSREHDEHRSSTTATATATQCLAISKVPIGARVLAENPRPEEFDDSFAEPVQSEWARVSFLIVRNDLSVVEAEFIRPRAWIESLGLVKGARLDLAVPELGIDGLAEVTAIRPSPPIAEGEGRVVTGKFVTRDVANVVKITLANGTEIRATDVHPIWSVDREDWVPAGKLEPGEHVDTLSGPVAVASVEPLERHPAVYNLEVHG
ncbi:MAG: Hint domain-containing protein, partial [Planctomycetia bacterium]